MIFRNVPRGRPDEVSCFQRRPGRHPGTRDEYRRSGPAPTGAPATGAQACLSTVLQGRSPFLLPLAHAKASRRPRPPLRRRRPAGSASVSSAHASKSPSRRRAQARGPSPRSPPLRRRGRQAQGHRRGLRRTPADHLRRHLLRTDLGTPAARRHAGGGASPRRRRPGVRGRRGRTHVGHRAHRHLRHARCRRVSPGPAGAARGRGGCRCGRGRQRRTRPRP